MMESEVASATRRLIILGSGTSTGVPTLGCDCSVCLSRDPRNHRTRPSALFRLPQGDLLIDTTPEMRLQLLRENVRFVHAIAYTHDHADHLMGLDDARLFPKYIGGPVPVFCEERVEDSIRRIFHYAFQQEVLSYPFGGVPRLAFRRIQPGIAFETLGERVVPIRLDHGRIPVLGFRIGGLAYCTDVKRIPEESLPLLTDLDVLVLDTLRYEEHPTHLSLKESLALIERLAPRRAVLTHLSHAFDHHAAEKTLPPHVRLAYDGLMIPF